MLDQYVKVDFHIHSAASKTKKGDVEKTKDNTFDNIDVLFERMNNSEVNIFSFTDHNTFDFDLYSKCKRKISSNDFKYNNIKNIFPGVEFDLKLSNDDSRTHATCIFNNEDPEKLKKINNIILKEAKQRSLNTIKFTPDELTSIIRKIKLDFILIVHQKSDIKNDNHNGDNDFSKLSEDIRNQLIYCDFFTLYESNQITYKFRFDQYKEEKRLSGNFITGTDCHKWKEYPDNKKNKNQFTFSYIKSDFTFNGIKIAITGNGDRRIVDSIPNKERLVNEIKVTLNNKRINIPLSSGINAIIGGNTSGKSLLIAKAFNKVNYDLKPQSFLDKWKLNIEPVPLSADMQIYKSQGEIRKVFEDNGANLMQEFEENFDKIDYSEYRECINNARDRLLEIAENNSLEIQLLKELDCLIDISDQNNTNFYPLVSPLPSRPTNPTKKIVKRLIKLQTQMDDLESLLEEEDKQQFIELKSDLLFLAQKYYSKNNAEKLKLSIFNDFISGKSDYIKTLETEGMKSSEVALNQYYAIVDNYLCNIETLLKKQLTPKEKFETSIHEFEIKPIPNPFDNLKYVTSAKTEKYSKDTILKILTSPFKNSANIKSFSDFDTINREFMYQYLLNNNKEPIEKLNYKQKYEMLLNEELGKNYFCDTHKILKENEPIQDTLSPGNNAVYYIKTITGKSHHKVIIFDQPEDDIAPEKVRTELINTLTKLAVTNQVIIVTHNPQLVVNLDVDNVICLDEIDNKYRIRNGPLYEKKSCNMLKIIADKLDGGKTALKERWKRYE